MRRTAAADQLPPHVHTPTGSRPGEKKGEARERLGLDHTQLHAAMLLLRCGSYMYNLDTAASDEDYFAVFVTPTRALLDRRPPASQAMEDTM